MYKNTWDFIEIIKYNTIMAKQDYSTNHTVALGQGPRKDI